MGQVTFIVIGAGRNPGGSPGPGIGCMRVRAGGLPLATATVNILDQNGAVLNPGMEVTDLTAFLVDLGTGMFFGRSDYFQDGLIDVRDFSLSEPELSDIVKQIYNCALDREAR